MAALLSAEVAQELKELCGRCLYHTLLVGYLLIVWKHTAMITCPEWRHLWGDELIVLIVLHPPHWPCSYAFDCVSSKAVVCVPICMCYFFLSKNSLHAKVTGGDFTFVATGDIPEMWIRDSAVQVRVTQCSKSLPFLAFMSDHRAKLTIVPG